MEEKQTDASFMVKLATWIVDKRNLIFLVTVIGLLFSAVSRNWVAVEHDLTAFLPEESDTKQALNVMDGQFTTFGSADVMLPMMKQKH